MKLKHKFLKNIELTVPSELYENGKLKIDENGETPDLNQEQINYLSKISDFKKPGKSNKAVKEAVKEEIKEIKTEEKEAEEIEVANPSEAIPEEIRKVLVKKEKEEDLTAKSREEIEAIAKEKGIAFPANIKTETLIKKINEKRG